jgi:hypothetical protein
MVVAGAIAPIWNPTFWFGLLVSSLIVSTAAFYINRLAFGTRMSWFQKYTYVPFLAIAAASLLILIGFVIARGLGL